MATRKRHHKKSHRKVGKKTTHRRRRVSGRTTTRRRRRVGASGVHQSLKDAAMLLGGVALGAVIAPFGVQAINTALGSNAATIPGWMVPLGGFATGGVIAGIGMTHKSHGLIGLGAGIAAVGAVMTANEAGLSEPGIAGTAFSNNTAPGARAITTSVGSRKRIGSPSAFMNNSVGNMKECEVQAIGALYSK
jgi:hypothetical protein